MCTAEAAVSAEQLCLERGLNLEHGKHEPCEPVEEHSGKQLVMFSEWICFSQQGEQRTIIPQVDWLWIKNNLLFSSTKNWKYLLQKTSSDRALNFYSLFVFLNIGFSSKTQAWAKTDLLRKRNLY